MKTLFLLCLCVTCLWLAGCGSRPDPVPPPPVRATMPATGTLEESERRAAIRAAAQSDRSVEARIGDPLLGAASDPLGLSAAEYYALLTADEIEVLRLRARGQQTGTELVTLLTASERENLRRRAAERVEIGAE